MNDQKKYWLRGGVISVIIYWVVSLILLFSFDCNSGGMYGYLGCVALYPSYLLDFIISLGGHGLTRFFDSIFSFLYYKEGPVISVSITVFLATLLYFFIGTFIGWIYGKIKNRNKNQINS